MIIFDLGKILMIMLNDVFDLFKIEVGKFEFFLVEMDFCYFLWCVEKFWGFYVKDKGLCFSFMIDEMIFELIVCDLMCIW